MARQYFNTTIADSTILAPTTGSITTITYVLTPAQANQCFPLPYGQTQPFAGQVYRFAMGGIMTTGTTGTMVITPIHGPGSSQTAGGTVMGASAAQTYVASLTNVPWHMEGELVYRTITDASTTSTAWLTGRFVSQGTLATAGSGLTVVFGSTAAVSVDTSGLGAAGVFGALNFGFTFGVASTVTAEYTSWQSLN